MSCKTEKKKESIKEVEEISVLEKVANAHGFENWKNVTQIGFTFNVDRDSTHFERSWIWKPKTNDVTYISGSDSLTYNRKSMDSIAYKTNGGFINDRYWLLAPFNLVWDAANFEYVHTKNEMAPIAQKPMNKLTIVYNSEGGYTPGDAYDFYFEDDYLIKEWVFRKANQAEPSMTTTWEGYVNHNGFLFAMDHKKPEENFNLFFDRIQTQVEVE
ncbi:hypothetical protein MTsPCn9_35280 [Croceitalea sp. MTPC9]|uniref:hypothetical protein n=1 Tax=unclassified Croceitalea TaxID=2632280 RepID=UPI002B3AD7F7|nr:hypothetical protein MTsPCn6_17910 [Croceitalea sp. MTPC6]GMN18588.1 hypothetical protein MTsPCn9_35280 [Croceitalea sp. MTPC9]